MMQYLFITKTTSGSTIMENSSAPSSLGDDNLKRHYDKKYYPFLINEPIPSFLCID